MKKNYLGLFLAILVSSAYGQKKEQNNIPDSMSVLFDRSYYDKYVVSQIRYTVLNTNSNVPGLKLNLGKNEITGTASLKSDDPIQTIDFSIGSNSDGLFSLFSNGSFDSKFKIGYNYHLIPNWSRSTATGGDYDFRVARRKYDLKKLSLAQLRDTVLVMTALIKEVDHGFNLLRDLDPLFIKELDKTSIQELTKIDTEAGGWLSKHSQPADSLSQKFVTTIRTANQSVKNKSVDVLKLYPALKAKITTLLDMDNELANAQIEYFGPFHTTSNRYWFTFSPSVEIIPVKAFSDQYKLDDFYSAKANIRAQFNILRRNSQKYALWRVGLQLGLTNNLTQLSKELYTYSKTTTLVKNDSISITLPDKADAYSRSSIKTGFGANLIIEYFQVPAEAGFKPGVFVNVSPGFNSSYKVNEQFELPVELGLVFSLLSDENKAIYLLPYVNFSNLQKFNADNRVFKRDWIVGLKVGLPFGLQDKK